MITHSIAPAIEYYTAADGRRLAARVWMADGPPLAHVVFLHGITSHGGWYEQVASHIRSAGCDVHFLDRRGSGLNAAERGDVDSWRTWINDVAIYLKRIRSNDFHHDSDRPPLVLCGISWGGKLAPAVARLHAGLIDAVALICPGIYSPFLPGRIKRAALAIPAPGWLEQRRVKIPLERPELFTDSSRWQKFIAEDPLALRTVTWRFAQQDRRLTDFARESAPFIQCPLLMMLAGRDQIVHNDSTRGFFAQVAGRRKTLIEYAAAAHTLEFETDPSQYFSDLTDWIRHVAQSSMSS